MRASLLRRVPVGGGSCLGDKELRKGVGDQISLKIVEGRRKTGDVALIRQEDHIHDPVQGLDILGLHRLNVLGEEVVGQLWKRKALPVLVRRRRVVESKMTRLADEVVNVADRSHFLDIRQAVIEHREGWCLSESNTISLDDVMDRNEHPCAPR